MIRTVPKMAVAGVAFVALLSGSGPVQAGPSRAACSGDGASELIDRGGGWSSIMLPLLDDLVDTTPPGGARPERDSRFFTIAASPGKGTTLFIATPDHVFRSIDGGCHWELVFQVGDSVEGQPLGEPCRDSIRYTFRSCHQVRSVQVAGNSVYIVLGLWFAGVSESFVAYSSTGGQPGSWKLAIGTQKNRDLSLGGEILAVSPSDPSTLYWTRNVAAGLAGGLRPELYASVDSGQTWERRGELPGPIIGWSKEDGGSDIPDFDSLKIDPLNPSDVWAGVRTDGHDALWHSIDGGKSWEEVSLGDKSFTLKFFDLARVGNQAARLLVSYGVSSANDGLAQNADAPRGLAVSSDGGQSWDVVMKRGLFHQYGTPTDLLVNLNSKGTYGLVMEDGYLGNEDALEIGRVELRSRTAVSLRSSSYYTLEGTLGYNTLEQTKIVHNESAFYILAGCVSGNAASCSAIDRYTGKGVR